MNGMDENIAPGGFGSVVDISAATRPRRSNGSPAGPAERRRLVRLAPNAQRQGLVSEVARATLVSVPGAKPSVSIDHPAA
jgi:hypothetical protein